jgi:Mg-chelatase subunit ChlD
VKKRFTSIELLVLLAIGGITLSALQPSSCRRGPRGSSASRTTATAPTERRAELAPEDPARTAAIADRLRPETTEWRDGLAAVVLVDVSGSMADRVRDADGERRRKIVIARRAAVDLVTSFEAYARAHPSEDVAVGVYEFSERRGQPAARQIVAPGPPDAAAATSRIETMKAQGGTPIGEAMIDARRALDATGLRRRHLLVVTDGENTDGVSPVEVARVMERQDENLRAPLYFVAFDVGADAFEGVKQHGGLVLPAKDGRELASTLDSLLSDRILVEAPRSK